MVKSLVTKLSSASSTLSIASSFSSSHGKNVNAAASTAISGDNYLKYRNDPGRFFGDGVQFKAKLIGILEVGEARGDRMCQEALQDLKMAIRAAGEHKQRITIHVTIDGLRLRDEKTGDSLYHHPVHKISFIAQDMTDSRAFGYIFGSPDSGHRFFGIKTDKAASQVVLAMRDLFQVVFELKKKEIELARQQIQSKSLHHHDQHQLASLSSLKSSTAGGTNDLSGLGGSAATLSMLNSMVSSSTNTPNPSRLGVNLDSKGASKEISPESVADLVDLEQELNSLQRGITQMERITPNDTLSQHSSLTVSAAKSCTSGGGGGGGDDPFGDSFTSFPTLPPPEPGRLRSKTTVKSSDNTSSTSTSNTAGNSTLLSPNANQTRLSPVSSAATTAAGSGGVISSIQPLDVDDDDNWLRELDAHSDVFDTSKTVVPGLMGMPPLASSLASSVSITSRAPLAARESSDTPPNHIYETVSCSVTSAVPDMSELSQHATNNETNTLANSSSLSDIFQSAADAAQNSKLDIKSDAFTDLDPLGIGRTRPYVDKKYFFQELKNPPKKVLKDLTITTTTTTANAPTTITSIAENQVNTITSLTDDILNLNDIEFKSQQQQFQHHQLQQQLHQQQQQQLQMTSTNINSLLTTTTTTTSQYTTPATTELATLTTTSVYSHASVSTLNSTINNTSTASANVNVSSNTNTASTSLICTCPTSIIVTCTTTNASNNRFINNFGNNSINNNNNLLTHLTSNSNNIMMSVGNVGGEGGGQSHILAALKSAAYTTTKLTSTSSLSSAQSQKTSINRTNILRFSRYPSLEPVLPIATDPVLLPRDTDPFSPTRKKSDPFEEGGDIFSKLDPFEFEFNSTSERSTGLEETIRKPNLSPSTDVETGTVTGSHRSQEILGGPLQVSLPPEGGEVNQPISTVRSRPVPSTMASMNAVQSGATLPPAPSSILRQQTADVISSISNKKMPHLFGQSSRFSKRDSNSINMRRLQESDSLSETETAPEPPPRPDSATYVEPPPLPPKKQFNDIVIRPRAGTTGSQSISSAQRYDSLNSAMSNKLISSSVRSSSISADVPPIPLPSRRVGRTDGSYPGPGRPRKPGHTEDDYLAPLGIQHSSSNPSGSGNITMPDVPPLLPPPTQISSRARTQRQQSLNRSQDIYENKNEILQQQQLQQQQQQLHNTSEHPSLPPIVPDITLSQLLTLGIEDLAVKLNVPTSKLSTMTLVELTSYLSEFLEQSNKPKQLTSKIEMPSSTASLDEPPQHTPPIFKVNFDQEATFIAKFDDTFGEDFSKTSSLSSFEANFAQFDSVKVEPPIQAINPNSVPPADRYAVFREIIDQELQQQQEDVDLIGDVMDLEEVLQTEEKPYETSNILNDFDMNNTNQQQDLLSGAMMEDSRPQPPKIDTKISEVLAQAKDRYAALRDLILVENLFDKPPPQPAPRTGLDMESLHIESKSPFQGFSGFNDDEDDHDLRHLMDQASTLDSTTQQQRLGLVDSRGFLVEPSSSAITVEEDEDEEEERRNTREDNGGLSSADSNEKEHEKDNLPTSKYEQLASSNQQLEEIEEKPEKYDDTPKISITQMQSNNDSKYLSVTSVASSGLSGSKDDLEIDDLMHRAISNLSLDSRERNSPALPQPNTNSAITNMTPPHFNDAGTSPIPLPRSPAGGSAISHTKSPNNKSPQQLSPLPSQLTVVSQLIDAATKQIQIDAVSKTSNDSWATFDTPQHQPSSNISTDKRARPSVKNLTKANNFLNLPPPPGSVSNCSQNDSAIESPCSSDPRDEAWHKHTMGGSSISLGGHHTTGMGPGSAQRQRYHKKDRQNTSSSSRDLSWDEDQGVVGGPLHGPPQSKRLAGQSQGSLTTDRHGYYRRHARRMNSCDEDYDYDQDYATSRRDQPCKYKHSLSRSRDNFEMDSPGWYHHHGGQHPHHTWSSQDIEQARGRTFDRSAYERTTYGPPIYDKRGVGPSLPPTSSYDRRSGGGGGGSGIGSSIYDKRSKYYRGDSNPRSSNADRIYNLDDFDEMLAASGKIPPHLASMYEEMKAEYCSPPMTAHQRQRAADYMYERERKSFDRESLESYEGPNVAQRRRRRSYDSGGIPSDPYGSCDSREDYHRERSVMTADKSRSLRKSLKSLRVSGDIDYDQDSEKEYNYRDQRSRCDSRSLQRPSQLSTQGISGGVLGSSAIVLGSQSRIRKSSGSSPWDGEEPALPGQKTASSSWKRPSSAAEAERRLAESRRSAVKGQTPSGSDEDKDRRYRKKRGIRNKDLPAISSSGGGRYRGSNYDYISCEDLDDDAEDYVDEEEDEDHGIEDDEISPADEDKFARLEMRRHEMHNRMMDAHVRRRKDTTPSQSNQNTSMAYRRGGGKGSTYVRRPLPAPTEPKHPQDYGYDDDGEYEQTPTPRSNTSSALPTAAPNTKFSFDIGFESDFNQSSPPPPPAGTASSCNSTPAANVSAANTPASKSSFRFSNDFSAGQDKEKHFQQHGPVSGSSLQQYDLEIRGISPQTQTQTSTPKLRFDDNVKVSQFDDAFEDDFSKATFEAFQNDDVQWQEAAQKTSKQQMRNNKLQQRQQDLIKKSESVNIFAKKVEDPFEDDEFFNSPPTTAQVQNSSSSDKQENHKTSNNEAATSNGVGGGSNNTNVGNNFQQQNWDDDNTNFAKFDENM